MQMKDSQRLGPLALNVVDKLGKKVDAPAFDQPPVFTTSDASKAVIEQDADGSIWMKPVDIGSVKIQASASIGGKAFAGESEEVIIVVGDADHIAIELGAPVDQP